MCGRSSAMRGARLELGEDRGAGEQAGSGRFFGIEVDGMSSRARVATALAVLETVAEIGRAHV